MTYADEVCPLCGRGMSVEDEFHDQDDHKANRTYGCVNGCGKRIRYRAGDGGFMFSGLPKLAGGEEDG